MLSVLALALPLCTINVASDAPNPAAILAHEYAHCWGWHHAETDAPQSMNYQAPSPSLYWRLKGEYPAITGGKPHFAPMREIKRLCSGHWGCMDGGRY